MINIDNYPGLAAASQEYAATVRTWQSEHRLPPPELPAGYKVATMARYMPYRLTTAVGLVLQEESHDTVRVVGQPRAASGEPVAAVSVEKWLVNGFGRLSQSLGQPNPALGAAVLANEISCGREFNTSLNQGPGEQQPSTKIALRVAEERDMTLPVFMTGLLRRIDLIGPKIDEPSAVLFETCVDAGVQPLSPDNFKELVRDGVHQALGALPELRVMLGIPPYDQAV